jgi:hypothetical protein
MAAKKIMLGQLASVGEGAFGRLVQHPMTGKAIEGAVQLKDRVEKLMNGVESLEERLTAVEKRLDALEQPKRRTTKRKTPAVEPPAAEPRAAEASEPESTPSTTPGA